MSTERHRRDFFFLADTREIVGETNRPATLSERQSAFRFSRIVPREAPPPSDELLGALAQAMVSQPPEMDGDIPAGFTYLGQFVDHDLTRDRTKVPFNTSVTVDQLDQGRSPALDLDSVYGLGPTDPIDGRLYQSDGAQLKLGTTVGAGPPPANRPLDGFDLPRLGTRATINNERRMADIPDPRNDENLAIAQTHLAFMRFHNAIVRDLAGHGTPSALLFEKARDSVVKHYQWVLVHDFLPRIADPAIVTDVFTEGRKVFETTAVGMPTMPVEFSVAAYRFGHTMIRDDYDWNRFFNSRTGALEPGSLENLFRFSGTSGNLSPETEIDDPLAGPFEQLPSLWITDWTRLYDFDKDAGDGELAPLDPADLNHARRIDTRLTDPLAKLPLGSFNGRGDVVPSTQRNLAFRNLVRSRMIGLASGQEVARHMLAQGVTVTPLTEAELVAGDGGVDLTGLAPAQRQELIEATPLWFYVLREAEVRGGRLGDVGARLVSETFHRAIEGSRISLLRDPAWRPASTRPDGSFRMVDILLKGYDASRGELRPLDPSAPTPALIA
ncbi:hypothetical protein IP69_05690 [Bosea sp. AAP35]|uniref:peroxidase family protein n=1 Tax=Bosea sp. AAP35 TaxID=1523417 RepID=UPI0006B996B8|nr:heme peroxidase family protein [Bosea sp. AAP35]KPF71653.1 hypothetical protein IP69_05690 [Bosea sp. AAP35]